MPLSIGDGGTILHTIFSETPYHLKNSSIVFLDLQNMG